MDQDEMVQLSNIPFQWLEAPKKDFQSCKDMESRNKIYPNKQLTNNALHTLKKKMNTIMTSAPSSLIQKIMSSVQMVHKKSRCKYSSSISLQKRTSFYRSFRNEVMNQNSGGINTDVLFKNSDYMDDILMQSKLEMQSFSIPPAMSSILHPPACHISYSNSNELQALVATKCKCDYEDPKKPCSAPSPKGDCCTCKKKKPKPPKEKKPKKQRRVKEKPKKRRKIPKLPEGEACRKRLSSASLSELSSARLCGEKSSVSVCSKKQSSVKISPPRVCSSECNQPVKKQSSFNLAQKKASSVTISPEYGSSESLQKNAKKRVRSPPSRRPSPAARRRVSPRVSPPQLKSMSPMLRKKPSASRIPLRIRVKHICSSIFGAGCTDRTCPNQKDRRPETQSSLFQRIELAPKKGRDKEKRGLNDFEDVDDTATNMKRARELAKCKERELEKIKEIHRHIQKEQEIERKIAMEQARHREKEKEIERELGLELARHRQREKNLMCDTDSLMVPETKPKSRAKQVNKCDLPRYTPKRAPKQEPQSPCPGIVKKYCTIATQDSGQKNKKKSKVAQTSISVDAVICMCDEKVGNDPKPTCTCATQYKKVSSPSLNRVSCGLSPTPPKKKPPKRKKPSPVCPAKPMPCIQVSSITSDLPYANKGWLSPVRRSISDEDSVQSVYDTLWGRECGPSTTMDLSAHVLLSPRNSSSFNRARCSASAQKVVNQKPKSKCKDSGVSTHIPPIYAEDSAEYSYISRSKDTSKCSAEYQISSKHVTSRSKYYSNLSQITSPIAISVTTHSTSDFTITPRNRNIQHTHVSKTDKNKYESEKKTAHKSIGCNAHWQRACRRPKDDDVGRQRKLSLESSIIYTGKKSKFNNLSDTKSETSASNSSIRSDARTDTTICTMATVDYDVVPRHRLYKVKVVTKSNQATSTEKTKLCDTGTLTYDWWSPMVERRTEAVILEKKKGFNVLEKHNRNFEELDRRRLRNNAIGGIFADGRFVKFRSGTQIIPTGMFSIKNETLSPSRYLLESQKYYNELFAYNICPPLQSSEHIRYRAPRIHERETTQNIAGRKMHVRKTKRLDECYSPRKQFSPRRRYTDSLRTSESTRKRPSCHYRKNVSRYYLKVNSGRKYYY